MGERVGHVPERESVTTQLVLQRRAENAGLDASQARCPVDLEHCVQTREVDRDDRTRLVRFRLQRARDRRASPERDHDRVVSDGRLQHRADLGLAGGAHHDIRDPRQVTPTLADQVTQRLPATVHDSVKRIGRDVIRPEILLQLAAQRSRQDRFRNPQRREARRGRRDTANIEPQLRLDERPQLGLVRVRELHPLLAPAPPFHLSHANPRLDRHRRPVPRRPLTAWTISLGGRCFTQSDRKRPLAGKASGPSFRQRPAKRTGAAPRREGVGACRSRIGRGTTSCTSGPARHQRCRFWNGRPRRRNAQPGVFNESAPVPAGYEAGLGARSREERYCEIDDDRSR